MMIGLWPAVFSLKKWEDRVVLFLGMGSVILALCLLYLGLNFCPALTKLALDLHVNWGVCLCVFPVFFCNKFSRLLIG